MGRSWRVEADSHEADRHGSSAERGHGRTPPDSATSSDVPSRSIEANLTSVASPPAAAPADFAITYRSEIISEYRSWHRSHCAGGTLRVVVLVTRRAVFRGVIGPNHLKGVELRRYLRNRAPVYSGAVLRLRPDVALNDADARLSAESRRTQRFASSSSRVASFRTRRTTMSAHSPERYDSSRQRQASIEYRRNPAR